MSTIGSPIHTSLVQAAQAQDTAGRARSREKAVEDRTQRYTDMLELRVAAVESAEATRRLPQNDSEQAGEEHKSQPEPRGEHGEDRPGIDVTA